MYPAPEQCQCITAARILRQMRYVIVTNDLSARQVDMAQLHCSSLCWVSSHQIAVDVQECDIGLNEIAMPLGALVQRLQDNLDTSNIV